MRECVCMCVHACAFCVGDPCVFTWLTHAPPGSLSQTVCDTPLTFLSTTKGNIRERILEEIMVFNGAGAGEGAAGAGAGGHHA